MDKAQKEKMKAQLKESFMRHLTRTLAIRADKATDLDRYHALAYSIRDLMVEKWINTKTSYENKKPKTVYYISLEFLIGRTMGNAMINLGVYEIAKEAMAEMGFDVEELREEETDAGLGNGGLGRLAACFIDSMATMNIPSTGFGIRYDYGMFTQSIVDGYQVEEPDNWLRRGNPWEIRRPEICKVIRFYGRTAPSRDPKKKYRREWVDTQDVMAMPYDTPIPGYDTDNVNTLRLWSAQSLCGLNLSSFNRGDYINANIEASLTENITKVLYPNDNNYEGKELRLKQQYFLVAASLQDIIGKFKYNGGKLNKLHERVSIQLNDTHPALAIPELMRILVDEEGLDWDEAWATCRKTCNYTNHTLMGEALERWPVSMLSKLLPRHMEIIFDLNYRFMRDVSTRYPGKLDKLGRMSFIEEGAEKMVRMAYMAIVGSNRVNGVAALHTELLKNGLFRDFYEYEPEKFINVTNGITPRRWLRKANPELSDFITDKIGEGWVNDLDQLKEFEKLAGNRSVQSRFREIKRANKVHLAKHIIESNGVKVDPDSMFDVQVKRLHEYKRQLLNALHAISLYLEIKDNPNGNFVPRTIIFGAKAAPGYYMAKMIIKLINSVGDVINSDRTLRGKLSLVFLANYRVSLAEKIIPAADLSEQISLAGTEASGTGNMKFALNGALTIGTMDGANVEINDAVGEDNIFIFGMTVDEVKALRQRGYDPHYFVEKSPWLKRALELIRCDFFSQGEPGLFKCILDIFNYDTYMVAADFNAYRDKQKEVSETFLRKDEWTKKAIINMSNMGRFSSDRSISDYAHKIWNVKPMKIK
ncbi:MAG: glycogen phosphorylase [Lentisphaerae bacterium GWF2_52_8]|nr:MAG: glycogen phosphorylase [Lentisphaerae bacterium GWF2_52_8]